MKLRNLLAKIRRLYDIANVLVSVGLIEKVLLSHSRKPMFRWLGGKFDPQTSVRRLSECSLDSTSRSDVDVSSQDSQLSSDFYNCTSGSSMDTSNETSGIDIPSEISQTHLLPESLPKQLQPFTPFYDPNTDRSQHTSK